MSSPILKLVVQRIAMGVVLLFAVSILIFVGTQILPGDVAQSILGQSATPQSLANLRAQLGLDQPAYVRYFTWLGGVLTLESAPGSGTAVFIRIPLAADAEGDTDGETPDLSRR